ncbi:hypothetical protein AGMMS49982_19390 [Bacteroidia bacterium]|nr:hypothetical protein AGMMS49982_19390 [Bacteroidia bacterium]
MNSAPVAEGVSHQPALGYGVGLDFTYFIDQRFGVTTGIGADFFTHNYSLSKFGEKGIPAEDAQGIPFKFKYTAFGYTEQQNGMLLTIPLRLQYETSKFYAAIGGKIGIPITAHYESKLDSLKTAGYFENEQVWFGDPDEETHLNFGFGRYPNNRNFPMSLNSSKDLQFNPAFFVTAEVGVKWILKLRQMSLYTGAYIEYGLNDIHKVVNQPNIMYDGGSGLPVRYDIYSALSSGAGNERWLVDKDNQVNGAFVDKVKPLYVGVKVALSIEHYIHDPNIRLRSRYEPVSVPRGTASQPSENAFAKDPVTTNVQRLQVINQLQRSMTNSELGFAFGKSDLSENGRKTLDRKIRLLQSWPDIAIRIEGHTDDIGTDEENILLGQQRADAVSDYMVKNGVDKRRIRRVVSKGESQPAVPNNSEENRAQNRRVQIIVLESWSEE